MHRLLRRQVAKHLDPSLASDPSLEEFLAAVARAYEQHDADRRLLERSMDLSSEELYESNQRLKEEMANQEVVLERLRASLLRLTGNDDSADADAVSLSRLLKTQIDLRVDAEQRLRDQEQRLQLVLRASPDCIFTIDHEGTLTSWNDGAEAITGFAAEEVLGHHVSDVVTDMDELEEQLREAKLTGHAHSMGWQRRKDGTVFWSDASLSALRDDDGQLCGFVMIARDLTEQRRDEEAMRLTKEAAEAASRAKSEFLANMSHEIRTPMNAVIGMTGLLGDTDLDGDQREMVETIQSSGTALLSLINDILDLSKIEAGMLTLESTRFDFRSCLASSIDVFRPLLKGNATRLQMNFHASAPRWVESDETRIRQILFNLIGNAVKFTVEGEIVVSVSSRSRDGLICYHASVRDTGIGIEPTMLRSIFQPFSQVEDAFTRSSGGTGLGLAISKRLVEALGGEIWVDSEVGVGSTFHFTFVVPETSQDLISTAAPDRPARPLTGDVKVLVVEDNPTNQRVVCRLLERVGIVADVVENGLQAVEIAKTDYYELIFMDVQMPVMNGLDATRAIRSLDIAQPYIIALTANAMPEDRIRCLESGMDEYLSKPIVLDGLKRAIQSYQDLHRTGVRRQAT